MDLLEQARRRIAMARELRWEPLRWVATDAMADQVGAEELEGLPLERGATRFGLELVCARPE